MTKSDGMFSKKMFRDPLIDRISFFCLRLATAQRAYGLLVKGFLAFCS